MQTNISEFQKHQIALIIRVTPYAMVGHLLNTTILAIAVAGEVRPAQLILWCIYSYSIALFLLYRHWKNRGRSPRSFEQATKKAVIYALLLALPWSGFAVVHLGTLSPGAELILIALAVGMAASGTILLSAVPPAAFVYMSGILLPSTVKCLALNQKSYLLLGALALSYWGYLVALITKITRDISERKMAQLALAERDAQLALAGKSARVGSYSFDIGTGMVRNSPGYATIHGLAEGTEEFPREQWRAQVHPDDLERLDILRDQAFAEQRREHNTEYRIVGPGGKVHWIESRALVSYDGDGRPERLVGINIDVTERKKVELALAERDALIGLAEKVIRVGTYAVDIVTGKVQLSAGCAAIHGFPEGTTEIRREDWRAGVHPDDLARLDRLFGQASAERRPEYKVDYRIIRSGAEVRWIEERAIISYDRDGRPERFVGVNIDVTERKRAEARLAERNAQLDLAGKIARIGSFMYDHGTKRAQLSPGCAAICGLPEGTLEISRDEWRAQVHPDDLPRLDVIARHALANSEREYVLEFRIFRDGQVRWIESRVLITYDEAGKPIRRTGAQIDVTERKQAEQALAERNIQLALAAKAGLVGTYAYDTDTEVMQISEGYAAIHGFPDGTAEIARSECMAGVHRDDIERVEQFRSEAFRDRRREYNVEYRIIRPDGELRWVETRCLVAYSHEGRANRVVGVSIDITERKMVEEQQRILVAELDHRVKNVLATVQAVAANTRDASSSMDHFVAALDGRIRSMGLTHEILSRRRWLGIPLAELVWRELAPYNTGSNVEIGGPAVMLSAEAGQTMAMVLHELVTNAAKHGALSAQSGRVSVRWLRSLNVMGRDRLVFEWRETGGPVVDPPNKSSYGMHTIRELVPYDLGGTVDHVIGPDGARCRMDIPLAQLTGKSSHAIGSATEQKSLTSDEVRQTRAG